MRVQIKRASKMISKISGHSQSKFIFFHLYTISSSSIPAPNFRKISWGDSKVFM